MVWALIGPPPVPNVPPVANFTIQPEEPKIGENVMFIDNSYDPDGRIVEWSWDFGDGTTVKLPENRDNSGVENGDVSHIYSASGRYFVTLTVTDDEGAIGRKTRAIIVKPHGWPTALFTYIPRNPTVLDIIHFIDNSYDPDGHIVGWLWDFGDGSTSSERNPTHQYAAEGSYTVTLTVTDNDGNSDSYEETVEVSPPPAREEYVIYSDNGLGENVGEPSRYGYPNNGGQLTFSETEEGCESDPEKSWKFTYQNVPEGWAGFYCEFLGGAKDMSRYENLVFWVRGEQGGEDFEIIVEDNSGNGGKVRISEYVRVTTSWQRVIIPTKDFGEDLSSIRIPWNIAFSSDVTGRDVTIYIDYVAWVRKATRENAPVAFFRYSPESPTTEENVQFTDNSYDPDGHIVGWLWDFGDGSTSSERNPTHQYAAEGSYTVTLTVTDNDGNSDWYSVVITVSSATPPPPPSGQITLSGFPDNIYVPENGSTTVTEFSLTNSFTESKTLRILCDAWSTSGGKLWCNIYTMNSDNVFVDGVSSPLILNPDQTKYLKLIIGTMENVTVGESFTLRLWVEDW